MRLAASIAVALAAALAGAPAAGAATLAPLKPCYRSVDPQSREPVHVHAEGFTPGSTVDVSVDGLVEAQPQALPDGTVEGDVPAPHQPAGQRQFTLTVTEHDMPANTVSASSRVAALGLRLRPSRAPASKRVRFIGLGFTDGPRVYAHYLHAGKVRRTVSLGVPKGPCGRVDVRRRQIPVRRPALGWWTLQVDNRPAYEERPAGVFVRVMIKVWREPRPQ